MAFSLLHAVMAFSLLHADRPTVPRLALGAGGC